MPFSVDELTVDGFLSSGWEMVVAASDPKLCDAYCAGFASLASKATETGDVERARLFTLLYGLTSLFIKESYEPPEEPFGPMWVLGEQRSAIPSDFDPALPYLSSILPRITDAELQARVADVLQLRAQGRDRFLSGRTAVPAYLAAAEPLQTEEEWSRAVVRIGRGLDIAVRLNQPDLQEAVVKHIETAMATASAWPGSFFPVALMDLLLKCRDVDPTQYSPLAEELAARAEGNGDWHRARECWRCAAEWQRRARDEASLLMARLRGAETYVGEAEAALQRQPPSHGLAAMFLESAIQALRQVGGQSSRVTQLHERLLALQPKAVAELGVISHEFDSSELTRKASQAVEGKNLYEALFHLARMGKPPSLAGLRQQTSESVIRRICGTNVLNAEGHVIAKSGPASGDDAADETALRRHMFQHASYLRSLHAHAVVEPARCVILREHPIGVDDFLQLVSDSPFVPPGREMLFARGLLAGMHGDFPVAVHLLVPQVEHSLRCLLRGAGVITTSLNDEGVQQERDLNIIFTTPDLANSLAAVFGPDGEDLVFDLRGLLVERFGDNLRNNMAHGLLSHDGFYQLASSYLWWLVLRLCCLPISWAIQAEQARTATAEDTTGATGEESPGAGEAGRSEPA